MEQDQGVLPLLIVGCALAFLFVVWAVHKFNKWWKQPKQRRRLTLRERGMTQQQSRLEYINKMTQGEVQELLDDLAACGVLREKEYKQFREKLGHSMGWWEFAPKGLDAQQALKSELKAKRNPKKEGLKGAAALRAAIASRKLQTA